MCCFPCWLVSFLEYVWFLVVSCKRCNLFFFALALSIHFSLFSLHFTQPNRFRMHCALHLLCWFDFVYYCYYYFEIPVFWSYVLPIYLFLYTPMIASGFHCVHFSAQRTVSGSIYVRELMQSYCTRTLYSHWQMHSTIFSAFQFSSAKRRLIFSLWSVLKCELSRSHSIDFNLTNDANAFNLTGGAQTEKLLIQ